MVWEPTSYQLMILAEEPVLLRKVLRTGNAPFWESKDRKPWQNKLLQEQLPRGPWYWKHTEHEGSH